MCWKHCLPTSVARTPGLPRDAGRDHGRSQGEPLAKADRPEGEVIQPRHQDPTSHRAVDEDVDRRQVTGLAHAGFRGAPYVVVNGQPTPLDENGNQDRLQLPATRIDVVTIFPTTAPPRLSRLARRPPHAARPARGRRPLAIADRIATVEHRNEEADQWTKNHP